MIIVRSVRLLVRGVDFISSFLFVVCVVVVVSEKCRSGV